MLTLKDLLSVCAPDWIVVEGGSICVEKVGLPDALLDHPVERISGWDDGLTIELCNGSSPCVCLPVKHKKRTDAHDL
jgi:hypothetical protein